MHCYPELLAYGQDPCLAFLMDAVTPGDQMSDVPMVTDRVK